MKNSFLWWTALVLGIIGILLQQDIIRIAKLSEFWTVVASAGLFAISTFKK